MKRADPFPGLLRAFFYEWMVQQRNASTHNHSLIPRHLAPVSQIRCSAPATARGPTHVRRTHRF